MLDASVSWSLLTLMFVLVRVVLATNRNVGGTEALLHGGNGGGWRTWGPTPQTRPTQNIVQRWPDWDAISRGPATAIKYRYQTVKNSSEDLPLPISECEYIMIVPDPEPSLPI